MTHEHLFIDMSNWYIEPDSAHERELGEKPVSLENLWYIKRNPAQCRDNQILGSLDEAIDEVNRYYQAGGSTIVDVTPKFVGEDPKRVHAVARETGVQFIQGTAYYVRSAHPKKIDRMSCEDIEQEFVNDVREGFGETSIRAGIVGEIGLSADENGQIHDQEIKVLRAGARAAQRTGAPLTIHPPGRLPRAQTRGGADRSVSDRTFPTSRWSLEVLDIVEEHLPLDRVVLDHMDRTVFEDLKYQKKLAERGAYLEYDLWGTECYWDHWSDSSPSDWWRLDAVEELIDAGYISNLLFSQDICTKIQRTKYGGFGYAHILNNVIQMLRQRGITQDQINQILVENPRRMLTFDDPIQ